MQGKKKQEVNPPAWFRLFEKFCLSIFVCVWVCFLVSVSFVANMGDKKRYGSGSAESMNDSGHLMFCFWLVSFECVSFLYCIYLLCFCSLCHHQLPATTAKAACRVCFDGQPQNWSLSFLITRFSLVGIQITTIAYQKIYTLCGGLKENGLHRPIGSSTTRSCGLVGGSVSWGPALRFHRCLT